MFLFKGQKSNPTRSVRVEQPMLQNWLQSNWHCGPGQQRGSRVLFGQCQAKWEGTNSATTVL